MPTLDTVTVKASGGDYTTLLAAEAAEQADLVSADVQLTIELYDLEETGQVVIDGWTTDATRYLKIVSMGDHGGNWNTGVWRLYHNTTSPAFSIKEEFVRAIGLQVHNYKATNAAAVQINAPALGDIQLDRCWIRNNATSNANNCVIDLAGPNKVTIRNLIGIGGQSGIYGFNASTILNIYNSTVVGQSANAYYAAGGKVCAFNCYGKNIYSTIRTWRCAAATAKAGCVTVPFDTNNFTNVTAGSIDVHLVSTADPALLIGGLDYSNLYTDDCNNNTRVYWSIGADDGGGWGGTPPTEDIVTVKSSGGDYTTLSAAEAGEQKNFITSNLQLTIECYTVADSTAVVLSGSTTDFLRYIKIKGIDDHNGVWTASAYNLIVTSYGATGINVAQPYTVIENIQVKATSTSRCICLRVQPTTGWVTIDRCLLWSLCTATANNNVNCNFVCTNSNVEVFNTVIIGGTNGLFHEATPDCWVRMYNCAAVACVNNGYYHNNTLALVELTNCYSGGHGTAAYGQSSDASFVRTTCAHSTATSYTGSTVSIAYTTANFTNVTAGTVDLHLVSGASSTLLAGGTDMSDLYTTDIDGDSQGVAWSIGPDALVVVADDAHALWFVQGAF